MTACYCGVDAVATCLQCGERRCATHYLLAAQVVDQRTVYVTPAGTGAQSAFYPPADWDSEALVVWADGGPACVRCRTAAAEAYRLARGQELAAKAEVSRLRFEDLRKRIDAGPGRRDVLEASELPEERLAMLAPQILMKAARRLRNFDVDLVELIVDVTDSGFWSSGGRVKIRKLTRRAIGRLSDLAIDSDGSAYLLSSTRVSVIDTQDSRRSLRLTVASGATPKVSWSSGFIPRADYNEDATFICDNVLGVGAPVCGAELRKVVRAVAILFD